jgi:hypothetical protein
MQLNDQAAFVMFVLPLQLNQKPDGCILSASHVIVVAILSLLHVVLHSCTLGPALSCGRAWQNKRCVRKVGCLVKKRKVSLKRNWMQSKVHVMSVDDIW